MALKLTDEQADNILRLAKSVDEALARFDVLDVALGALIATHPDPQKVRNVLHPALTRLLIDSQDPIGSTRAESRKQAVQLVLSMLEERPSPIGARPAEPPSS